MNIAESETNKEILVSFEWLTQKDANISSRIHLLYTLK